MLLYSAWIAACLSGCTSAKSGSNAVVVGELGGPCGWCGGRGGGCGVVWVVVVGVAVDVVGGGGCAVGAYRHWYIGWSIPGAFQRGTDRVICSRVAWLDWCITHPYPST